jgi:ATP-dependent DNA helicase RecQ
MEVPSPDPVADLASERFGVKYLFPLQRLVIANVLDAAEGGEGLRQIALLPTGFGKSLCFQLPALLLPGPTIAVYPLLALIEDQRRRLAAADVACAAFRGGMPDGERAEAEAALSSGRAKLVLTNPECLRGRLLGFLAGLRPSHLAIDEAHCVSEWGETFRPAYLELGRAIEALAPRAVTAFTATASPPVLEAVSRILFGGEPATLVDTDADRPNIHYSVRRCLSRERAVESLIAELGRPAIVFASSREGVQILAELLRARLGTREVRFYHAGLSKEEKEKTEKWFYGSTDGILTATCAYGMGVDKRNIRTVIHYEPPPSVEAYLQESGRAGRDGLPARAVLILGPETRATAAREKDQARRARREALIERAEGTATCRREAYLGLLGADLGHPCEGCDVCEGRALAEPEGKEELRDFVRANPRRFDESEAVRLLLGKGGEPPDCAGSGAMTDWRKEDVVAALRSAIREGIVGVLKRGPWKGKLVPANAAGGVRGSCLRLLPRSPGTRLPALRRRLPSFSGASCEEGGG